MHNTDNPMDSSTICAGLRSPAAVGSRHQGEAHLSLRNGMTCSHAVAAVPVSAAQQRLWFFDQLESQSAVYNLSQVLRLQGVLNVETLEKALNALIARHESLRTTFAVLDGEPRQVIAGQLTLALPVTDLQERCVAQRETEALRLATEEVQRPFDLAHGPLVRLRLLRLGAEEHLLVLTLHNIIADDPSLDIFLQEVFRLYRAFSTGSSSPLQSLTRQYADFVHWQRQWCQGESGKTQLAYWRQHLADSPSVLELPADRPRPAQRAHRGAIHSLSLPTSLMVSLQTLSQHEGVPLRIMLLTALQTLLYRYTGQLDIAVGSPVANRTRPETAGVIGLVANTLVLRTDLSGEPTLHDLLQRVQEVVVRATAHQDLPFATLIEALQPERDQSHTPLCQVIFACSNDQRDVVLAPGLEAEYVEFDRGRALYDLALEVTETATGLSCRFEYNTDLFDAATITRLGWHYQTLLEGAVSNAAQPIATLPLLTPDERQRLLVEWNTAPGSDGPSTEDAEALFLHQHFAAQAERTPQAIAIVYEEHQLTYRELDSRANQVASYLQGLGVEPDVCVGICMERSPELVFAILGVLKAGGACVPLDPAYPQERLDFMLTDLGAPLLLTQERLQRLFCGVQAQVVCLDTDWERIHQEGDEPPTNSVTTDNLAFVFYTSGSTGHPKAVMRYHVKRTSQPSWNQQTYALTAADHHLLKTPIGFTLLSLEIFLPLLTGARMIIARPGGEYDAAYLANLMAEQRITLITLVPSLLRMLLEEPRMQDCERLRHVVCFGEPLSIDLQERFFARLSAELSVFYGTTEAPSATYWQCQREDTQRMVGIGRPRPNRQVYILDSYRQPVPIGVPGELYIGGQLARGYRDQPDLTAEKFLPDPFRQEPEARLYKTGDLARYRPDGNIEFLGRSDYQVKMRGVRIELGEIEAILSRHPAVREAVVIAREGTSGEKYLLGYVVPIQQPAPSARELRGFLLEKLPAYMVPATFVCLDALPLTPHGKLDRRALPLPEYTRPDGEASFVGPDSPVEAVLAEIWATVLRVERVGMHDNFFVLGGDSLKAMQVIARLLTALQIDLPLRKLFETPTIAELASTLTHDPAQGSHQDDLRQLLAEIEGLSEAEAQALLGGHPPQEPGTAVYMPHQMSILSVLHQ